MIKQNKIKKNIMALFLAVATIVPTCPQWMNTVHAAEPLDCTKFATVDELKNFNTDDTDGTKNAAKVYFGNDDQQWWIVGSQKEQGLTLFAASPLAIKQVFEPNYSQNKTDPKLWADCSYTIGTAVTEVYPNHYGASHLRTKLKELETSYFSGKEQALMNETKIYTNDTKNSSVYSTTDKLYLAYGDWDDDQYVTVGKNTSDSLNNGLRIDKAYWGGSTFWLRAPYEKYDHSALVASPGYSVFSDSVHHPYALVPAFELNLSSVIFASAAPAASSNGDLTLQNTAGDGAFTLRYAATNLGSALVSYDKSKVKLTNVPNDTYLVVQYNAEAKAKQIANETEVSATEMGLANFANCKVWLESTDSEARMTYATLATEEQGHDVNIRTEAGLTITSNNGVQAVVQGNTIADITVEVTDGYYLPEDYINNLQGQMGGLTVTKTDSGFTISGTPTSDVNIQLPAATPKPVSGSGSNGGGSTVKLNPVYRAYNPNNGEHLYTLDEKEYKHVTSLGWHDEGVAFMAETEKNGQALYRVYNPNSGLHHYTSDENEKNMLVSLGWDEEGIAWYASNKPQSAPVYRVYNPNDGQHHYTMDGHEKDVLVSLGWTYEGIAFKTAPIE